MSKDRIRIASAFASGPVGSIDLTVLRALVNCLDPAEVCEVFDTDMEQPYQHRHILLQKIVSDMAERQDRHTKLIDDLLSHWESLSYPKKQSGAFVLSTLYDLLPVQHQEITLRLFLASRYKAIRKRGYALLRRNPESPLRDMALACWEQFQDEEKARTVIEFASASEVEARFRELDACVKGTWLQNRLYVRMAEADATFLATLEDRDGIAFAYACVKTHRTISSDTAKKLYKQYARDERVGLLIWCFGKLRLWDVLLFIAKLPRELPGNLQ